MSTTTTVPFTRTGLTWQAYILTSYYSYLLNALGPLTPFLRDELGLSYTLASYHFSAFAIGVFITGLLLPLAARKVSEHRLVWLGAGGMALGALLVMAGRSALVTIPGAFLMGFLGVLVVSIANSLLAEMHGEHSAVAFAEGSVLASLVATLSPVAVGFFARTALSWRAALGLGVVALPLVWLAFRRMPIPAIDAPAAAAQGGGRRKGFPARFWLFWGSILLAVAIEFCLVFWSADYLENSVGLARADAALAVSAFLGAMLVGRMLNARLLWIIPARRLLWIAYGLALGGFLLFWAAPQVVPAAPAPLALLGLMIAGLGVAGLFPIINSFALATIPGQMVAGSGTISLAVGVAIFSLPLVLGALADALGIWLAFGTEAVIIVLSAGLAFFANRRAG